MALPDSRNRTYTVGSMAASVDLNDIQDAIIADERWKDISREMLDAGIRWDLIQPGREDDVFLRTWRDALAVTASGTMNVGVMGGDVLWDTESGAGDDYQYVHGYYAGGTVAIATAHATLPRWDIISAKVERGPSGVGNIVTIQYTQGTAAASPNEPAVPGGYQRIARVEVAATDTSIDQSNLIDYRRPLGGKRLLVPTTWGIWTLGSLDVYGIIWTPGAAGEYLRIPILPPDLGPANDGDMDHRMRLQQLRLQCLLKTSGGTPGHCKLFKRPYASFGAAGSEIFDFTSQITDGVGDQYVLTVPEGVAAVTGSLWSNGERSPKHNVADDNYVFLEMKSGDTMDSYRGLVSAWWGA